ncbi:MAG: glycosyltransferase family 4 protein, partial [Candidatus Dormibacteraeota bacterium]|nr:glycosyltransferase family 4 protein [Candidatus Dormibacteraeota bacterium]
MRLLVLTSIYPPQQTGGYELLCAEHVEWLMGRGHEVTVVTSTLGLSDGLPVRETGAAGETVVRCLELHVRGFLEPHPPNLARVWASERRQREALRRAVEQARPEAALVWGMASVSKSLLQVLNDLAVGLVAVVGEQWPVHGLRSDPWLRLWRRAGRLPLGGGASRWAARVFAPTDVSRAMTDILPLYVSRSLQAEVESGQPLWRGRGRVVPNGIRTELFRRPRDPAQPLH